MMRDKKHYSGRYFEYSLIDMWANDEFIKGWQLKAQPGQTKFKCESTFKGYPVISLAGTFGMNTISEIDVSEMDTSNIRSMQELFNYAVHIKSIDLSNWDISKVVNFNYAFAQCFELEELILPKASIKHSCSLDRMYDGCKKLSKIDMSNLEVTDMLASFGLFNQCHSAESIDIRGVRYSHKDIYGSSIHYADTWFKQNDNLKVIVVQNKSVAEDIAEELKHTKSFGKEVLIQKANSLDKIIDRLTSKLKFTNSYNTLIITYN